MSIPNYIDLSQVFITPYPEFAFKEGAHVLIRGIELQSPAISMAAAHGLAKALKRPDAQRFLKAAGLTEDATRHLTEQPHLIERLCKDIKLVIPASHINASAALSLNDQTKGVSPSDSGNEHAQALVNYLIAAGAHREMMLHLCGITHPEYTRIAVKLNVKPKVGRPATIKDQRRLLRVLDEWAKLLRTEKSASDYAFRNSEPFAAASLAELYVALHLVCSQEDIASLYAIVEARP